jgi:hypothetical protein
MTTQHNASAELNEADIVQNVICAAEGLRQSLAKLCQEKTEFDLLRSLKFEHVGFNPAHCDGSYHVIEQINQSMTYLTTACALKWLKAKHPDLHWHGSLGPAGGTDIFSSDESVLCEVFAAVNETNNQKLKRDIEKILKAASTSSSVTRYVFCCLNNLAEGPGPIIDTGTPGVTVVKFNTEELKKLWNECL